jgi:hypothetical protein
VGTQKKSANVGSHGGGGRNGSVPQTKGLLPSTWIGRGVRLEYLDGYSSPIETTGVLLDTFPVGPVLNLSGARVCLPWERLLLIELVED